MIRPPPRSTLFPSPPPSRSAFASAEALARRAVALDPADAEARARLGMTVWMQGEFEAALAEVDRALALSPNLDRKSTRLNSSHLVISYAVFCLKKKRITTHL